MAGFKVITEGLEGKEVIQEIVDYITSEKHLRNFGRDLIVTAGSYNLPDWQRGLLHTLPNKLR
jgi:hypothetical protein